MSNSKFYRVFTFVFSKKEVKEGIYAPLNIYTSAHPSDEVMSGREQLLCENVQKRDIDVRVSKQVTYEDKRHV